MSKIKHLSQWFFAGWFLRFEEHICGPICKEQIRDQVAKGKLRETDRIWERWINGNDSLLVPTTPKAATNMTNITSSEK